MRVKGREGPGVGVEGDGVCEEELCEGGPEGREDRRVQDEGFERVAGRHVVGL